MKPRISNFKICTCSGISLKMTQKGTLDAKNASLNGHSKRIVAEKAQKTAKEQAEAALDWLLSANNKSPKFMIQC